MTHPMSPEERPRVLVVDDEKFIREILAEFLGTEGYLVRTAEDGSSALAELGRSHYDLVISDLKMPKMGGMELLEAMTKVAPNALTVIMTGFGTVETAIDAMKRGAYDYILKPFKVEEVTMIVQRGLEKQRLCGFIAVGSITGGKRFDEGQRKLLSIIGSRAAAAIENARLYEDLRATFQQTIEGLAKAIDKMDRYTSGHSDRVAMYATLLAG